MEKYFIEFKDRSGRISVVPVQRFPFTIGRGAENDLVIPEQSVSRRHAFIRKSADGFTIVDNKSRNGVYINRERILHQRWLQPGDLISIGSARLKLNDSGGPMIRPDSGGPETLLYLPSRETWDSLQSLSSELAPPRPGRAGRQEQPGRRWQSMLRRFLGSPPPEAFERLFDMVESAVPFDRCFLIHFENGSPDKHGIVASRLNTDRRTDVMLSASVLKKVARGVEAVIVKSDDSAVSTADSFIRSGASSAAGIPLIVEGRAIGVLYLDRLESAEIFTEGEIEMLGPLAGLVALKVENLQLLKEHIAGQVNLRDLELAKGIQEDLLPQEPVFLPGYSLEGCSFPCFQVGGDYFDIIGHEESALTVVIGDVSGHGLSSALYMAGVRASLHAHIEDGVGLDVLMARLDRHVRTTFRSDHFLTLFIGHLQASTGIFTYANAGHFPPIGVRLSGETLVLEATDPALNIVADYGFRLHQHRLVPGEILMLYTDGLTEAESPAGEQFGEKRLLSCLARNRGKDISAIIREAMADIVAFTGSALAGDDRTLVIIRRDGP